MAKRDFYEVLGLGRSAAEADLKRAYRQMAMKYHPDRNPGDAAAEARFKEVNEAYEILKDPQKRAAYDQFGHQAFEGGMAARGGAAGAGFDFSQLRRRVRRPVRRLHGRRQRQGARPRRRPRRRSALQPDDHAGGGVRGQAGADPRADHASPATAAAARGSEAGSEPAVCPGCRGAGRVRSQQGFFTVERTCPTCQGAGRVIKNPCKGCGGSGVLQREKTLAVNIPAGVEDGTRIRLSGEGEAAIRGGAAGRPLHLRQRRAAPAVPARGRQHLLPRADPDADGGAGRPGRGADDRGPARCASRSRPGPRPASRSASRARA